MEKKYTLRGRGSRQETTRNNLRKPEKKPQTTETKTKMFEDIPRFVFDVAGFVWVSAYFLQRGQVKSPTPLYFLYISVKQSGLRSDQKPRRKTNHNCRQKQQPLKPPAQERKYTKAWFLEKGNVPASYSFYLAPGLICHTESKFATSMAASCNKEGSH